MFCHVGTAQEYLHHFCRNKVLFDSYQLEVETMVCDVEALLETTAKSSEFEVKKHNIAHFVNCAVIHTVLHDRNR